MAPYEAFYGRSYRSPIHWADVGEQRLLGPKLYNKQLEDSVNQGTTSSSSK